MFPSLSIPIPRPPDVRVPLVKVVQWGFLFPTSGSSFLSINMCLAQRRYLNPHLPKTKIPLCHSQAFSQRGATTWQLLLQGPLWARVLRVLTQKMRRWSHAWVTCVSVRASQLCQHIPGDAGGFPKKGLQRLNSAGQKKHLWNMVWLWLLPNDNTVLSTAYQFCHISPALRLHLCFHHSTTLLASELLAAIYPCFFSQQSFGGGGGLCEFFSPRGIRNGVTLCITKHLHHHRKIKETSALVYITHSYI